MKDRGTVKGFTADAPHMCREALSDILDHFADAEQGPGHCHTTRGIWDEDISNGDRAGKPCDWCAKWGRARAVLAANPAGNERQQIMEMCSRILALAPAAGIHVDFTINPALPDEAEPPLFTQGPAI